jgi:3-hydroxy-5-methyl-1-naphthoate 3-O-methyltransferase
LLLALDELRRLDRNEMTALSTTEHRAPLTAGFRVPTHDLGELLGRVGNWLFPSGHGLVQFLGWAVNMGLFELLGATDQVTVAEVSTRTPLNERGADALLGILCALGLATRSPGGHYRITAPAREYFLRESPFFIGDGLKFIQRKPHALYLREAPGFADRLKLRLIRFAPAFRYGSPARIANQHARNLASCAAAVRTGEFSSVRCLVDIAGGSGTFSIPLALEQPRTRIILAEVPEALQNVRPLLEEHHVQDRVELLALDAFRYPWDIPPCDGIFIGNFLHGFDDETGRRVCRESFQRLESGGRVWVHELLWNDNKDGPLLTAMWNAAMRSAGAGRQRTGQELKDMLRSAGFEQLRIVPTAGAFALVTGRKP